MFAELFCFNNDNYSVFISHYSIALCKCTSYLIFDVNVDNDYDVIIDATRLQECYCHVLLGFTLITVLLVYFLADSQGVVDGLQELG